MKAALVLTIIYGMIFPSFVFADQALSCKLNEIQVNALNLTSGTTRLELLSRAAAVMENPAAAKPIGEAADSQSVGMSGLTRLYGAALLTSNEQSSGAQAAALLGRCNDKTTLNDPTITNSLQMYAQACSVYSLVNKLVALIAESDTLTKNNILMKATQNTAAAEKIKRDNNIAKEKQKIKDVNKEIKAAIDAIDKAKKEQKKATEALTKATAALAAANAIVCDPDAKDDSCEKAKGEAVAAAAKAVAEATKKLDEATKKLNKAVAKMIDLLTTKYGVEASAVLAILNSTVIGDAEGNSVNFKVAGNDFQLVDLNKTISGLTGDSKEKAEKFIDSPMASDKTTDFFTGMMGSIETSANKNSVMGNDFSKDNSQLGSLFTSENGGSFLSAKMTDATTTRDILAVFGQSENGADHISTIALALLDYTESKSNKALTLLEENKTPESRIESAQKEMDKNVELLADLSKMIDQTVCYLDKSLMLYKDFYKITYASPTSAVKKDSAFVEDPFYLFINNFTTDQLKKKIKEGYTSGVNYKGIQTAFECYAKGGNSGSCTIAKDTPPGGQCFWSGAVIGPSLPATEPCDLAHLGQILERDVGTQQCTCN